MLFTNRALPWKRNRIGTSNPTLERKAQKRNRIGTYNPTLERKARKDFAHSIPSWSWCSRRNVNEFIQCILAAQSAVRIHGPSTQQASKCNQEHRHAHSLSLTHTHIHACTHAHKQALLQCSGTTTLNESMIRAWTGHAAPLCSVLSALNFLYWTHSM